MAEEPRYGFSKKDCGRIARTIKQIERHEVLPVKSRRLYPKQCLELGLRDAYLTSNLPGRDADSTDGDGNPVFGPPGEGSAQIKDFDAIAKTYSRGDVVTVCNGYLGDVSASSGSPVTIKIGWQQGAWFFVGVDC